MEIKPNPKRATEDCACGLYDNTSSENDTENYSEDEDDASDLENNLSERKSMSTFSANALLDSKKGAFPCPVSERSVSLMIVSFSLITGETTHL